MKPTKEELERHLKELGREAAKLYYGKTDRTIRRWMDEYGLTHFDGKGAGKLNFVLAKRIRALYASDQYTQDELAEMFGVSQSMVCRIVNNEAYRSDVTFGGTADVFTSEGVCKNWPSLALEHLEQIE